ncbi:MAG: hypothetical protein IPJ13_10515 [Saprospiraceae bacterium]|nr:hypothetical protein [Saprospiraceae bacterium]
MGLNALDNLIFGSEPLEERVVNAANEIVTPVPSKMPKVGKLSGVSTLEPGPYAKESIKTNSTSQKFNKSQRQEINRIGNETGCHTCGSTDPGTKSGNFVPDHQPIGVLNPNNKSFDLFPHCINCSKSQGGTVSQIVKNQKSGKK